jgi:hypothetical protein
MSGGLNLWLTTQFKWSLLEISSSACKIGTFSIYTLLDMSVLIIVIMTGEKLFAVTRPIKCHQVKFNKKRSIFLAFFAFIFCATVNSHYFYTYSILGFDELLNEEVDYEFNSSKNKNNNTNKLAGFCRYEKWKTFYQNYWAFIDASIYSFLPLTLLSIFNILIVIFLIKAARVRSKLKSHERTLTNSAYVSYKKTTTTKVAKNSLKQQNKIEMSDGTNFSTSVKMSKNRISNVNTNQIDKVAENTKNVNKRLTVMMLLINISFCLMSMPIVISQIKYQLDYKDNEAKLKGLSYLQEETSEFYSEFEHDIENYYEIFDFFKSIAEILQYLNHSINFFLYCLSGKTFRKETKNFLSKLCCFKKK